MREREDRLSSVSEISDNPFDSNVRPLVISSYLAPGALAPCSPLPAGMRIARCTTSIQDSPVPSGSVSTENVILIPNSSSVFFSTDTMTSGL